MKILTVIYNLEKGGTQRAAQVFSEGYKELGYDSRVLSLYGQGSRYDELIKKRIIIYTGLSKTNISELLEWSPDIIHIHSHGAKHEDIMFLLDSLHTCNSKIVETNVFSTISSWSHKIDLSFQLSTWCQWLYYIRGGDNEKNVYVPNPVNTLSFSRVSKNIINKFKMHYNIPLDAFVIGRIGQSFSGKWSYTIVDLFNKVASINDNVYLVLVNPPSDILALIRESLYSDRIIHIETIIGDQNLSIAYSSFDVMYMGVEQGESFGMVIPEAILCGTPVISLATPWADNSQCEVTGHNIGGYVVNTVKSAVDIINKMINRTIQYDSKKGIAYIKEKYDYLNVSKMVIDLLQNKEKPTVNSQILNNNVINILDNAYDKPNIFTKIFLKLHLRRLTIYSSGYFSWKKLSRKLLKKIFNMLFPN